jgi:hypothetical protein
MMLNRSAAAAALARLTVTARQASAPKRLNPSDAAAAMIAAAVKTLRLRVRAD